MIRRAGIAAILLLVLVATGTASASSGNITISDFRFTPSTVTIAPGNQVSWSYPTGGSHHTSTFNYSATTWGSMAWSFAFSSAGGGAQMQTFHQAGAWSFHCAVHSFMTGTVNVTFSSNPTSGPLGTTFTLTLGNAALASGFVHDIQKRKLGGTFATWKSTSAMTQNFKPLKKRTYQFQTRVRNTASGQATGWSPIITLTVS